MTMTTDLAKLDDLEFVPEKAGAAAEKLAISSAFLPRLQIMGSSTELVQEGVMPLGVFALVHGQKAAVDIGKEISVLACSLRSKAVLIPANKEPPVAYYDKDSDDFKKVQAKAQLPGMNGAIYGPEFLLWVPSQETFATFMCGNETLRRVAPGVIQLMRKDTRLVAAPVKMRTKFIEGRKFKWWGCEVFPESTPLPNPKSEDWLDSLKVELTKFNNPPKSEVEPVPEETTEDTRVR